jgi:hypothetical protein
VTKCSLNKFHWLTQKVMLASICLYMWTWFLHTSATQQTTLRTQANVQTHGESLKHWHAVTIVCHTETCVKRGEHKHKSMQQQLGNSLKDLANVNGGAVVPVLNSPQTNSVAWVRERTIPTERPPLVSEVSGNFCGWGGVTPRTVWCSGNVGWAF